MPQAAIAWVASALVSIGVPAAAATAVAGAAVAVAGTLALNAVENMLKPKLEQAGGGQVAVKLDVDAGIPVTFGRTAAGGNVVYRQGYDTNHKILGMISVLSAGPIESFEGFYVNDTLTTFSGSPNPTATGAFNNRMFLWTKTGTASDTAHNNSASGQFSTTLPGWGSSYTLPYLASAFLALVYDTGKYPTGVPATYHVIKGIKAYDPRKDSTYPGGSGTHRLATPSTWEWSENPWICALAWVIGSFIGSKKFWGIGAPAAYIDFAAYVDAANVADANAWTCGGVVTTADDKWEVLKALCQAGGGEPLQRGAQISCFVNSPKTSVYTLTLADLAGAAPSLNTHTPRRDRKNKITPKYRSETHRWQVVAAAPVTKAAYLTEDRGEIRAMEQEYSLVQNVTQASQLAGYGLANLREAVKLTWPGKPRCLNVRVGDAVTVNLAEAGLSSWKAICTARSFDPMSAIPTLTLRSETDAKHAWALGLTGTALPTPTLPRVDPTYVDPPGGGAASAVGGVVVV